MNQGIFTAQGLIAFVFAGFGLFLFYKGRDKANPSTRTDKKIYIGAIISLLKMCIRDRSSCRHLFSFLYP